MLLMRLKPDRRRRTGRQALRWRRKLWLVGRCMMLWSTTSAGGWEALWWSGRGCVEAALEAAGGTALETLVVGVRHSVLRPCWGPPLKVAWS